jgi:hypothetical protein
VKMLSVAVVVVVILLSVVAGVREGEELEK